MSTRLADSGFAIGGALFNDMLDADLLASVAGMGPATLATDGSGLAQAALAYTMSPGSSGAAALQLIVSSDEILGHRVDFTG